RLADDREHVDIGLPLGGHDLLRLDALERRALIADLRRALELQRGARLLHTLLEGRSDEVNAELEKRMREAGAARDRRGGARPRALGCRSRGPGHAGAPGAERGGVPRARTAARRPPPPYASRARRSLRRCDPRAP